MSPQMENTSPPSEIWPEGFTDVKHGFSLMFCSSVFFYLVGKLASKLAFSEVKQAPWKWKNTFASFVHACISGVWSVLSFYETPKLAEDMISTYSTFSYSLVAFSLGYFIYDFSDMLINQRNRQTYELIGHHSVILVCFMISITTHLYVGYACVSMLVEVNSIFLHSRQILQIFSVAKTNNCYRLNSLVNLGTFIVFRISLLAWMTRWIVINKDYVPLVFYSVGSIGLAIMTVMNAILFYRLLMSDFFRKKSLKSKNE